MNSYFILHDVMAFRKILVLPLLLFYCTPVAAQLCQGSLGDPIVNINFGAGSNPGAPLNAATTNYQYISTDCPNDGAYTVVNRTNSCFGSTWHTLTSDHTGNSNGYFMLVNASFQPSAFYIDTVHGLCGSTTYEFAAWIINMTKSSSCSGNPIKPNLTFRIEKKDGTVLQSYTTGDIAALANPQWKQYGFYFTTPAGVQDVVIRIVNNANGGCGNDLALDDITFRPCGPKLIPSITGNANTVVNICKGETKTVNFSCNVSAGFNQPVYQWQMSTNNSITWTPVSGANTTQLSRSFIASDTIGTYSFRLTVAELDNSGQASCTIASDPLQVVIHANPVFAISNNSPVCSGKTLSLSANGNYTFKWTGVNGLSVQQAQLSLPNIKVAASGKYYIAAMNAFGCTTIDSTEVTVKPLPVVSVNVQDTTVCEGDSIQLIGSGTGSYSWIPVVGLTAANSNNTVAIAKDSVVYRFIVTDIFNCSDTAIFRLNVIRKPVIAVSGNTTYCERNTLSLQASGGNSLKWLLPGGVMVNGAALNLPQLQVSDKGIYKIQAVNAGRCSVWDSVNITVNPVTKVGLEVKDTAICLGDTIRLKTSGAAGNFSWIPAVGLSESDIAMPLAFPQTETQYRVILQNSYSCADTALVHIQVITPPQVSAGPDKTIMEGQSVVLNGQISGTYSKFYWSPSLHINNINLLQTVVNPVTDALYVLHAESEKNCFVITDTVLVKVFSKIQIPNAFSPNGDGMNDVWNIEALNAYPQFRLTVFNRSGMVVYEANRSYSQQWNGIYQGRPLPVGVYYYALQLTDQPLMQGYVLLLR